MSTHRLDELTTVVLAPNPSPMTLDGTNTYLVGAPSSGGVVVVDPGPDIAAHRIAVEAAAQARDARVAAVVFTHHHADHAAAAGWADGWGVAAYSFTPHLIGDGVQSMADGERIERAGVAIDAVHTPGHASDHLCLRVDATGAVLTGDHVLGRGTTVVAWPDGDMAAYMASLDRLARLDATVLFPGHGPALEDPRRAVTTYIAHRLQREAQVVAALQEGDTTPAQVVTRVYADVDVALHPAAERSVRAHLDKLVAEERVAHIVDPSLNQESYRAR